MIITMSPTQTAEIIFCTGNQGKIREFSEILGANDSSYQVKPISQFLNDFDPEETGHSFHENALIKAQAGANLSSTKLALGSNLFLSDDSGIEIEALEGRPGIYSGRYLKQEGGGIQGVLEELANETQRQCRFVCCMVLVDQNANEIFKTEQYWNGTISHEARGNNGFGYDPIVIPEEYKEQKLTVAELDTNIKTSISHRAQALLEVVKFLETLRLTNSV